jgi:diadenosine tetraphosphate (Ap4A) HIT family hydrolase
VNATPDTVIHRRVAALRAGGDPGLIARLESGWVVLGDPQVIRGYCLLLPDPVVPQLNALTGAARGAFLADMARTGDVLSEAMQATRINYAIFGNVDPALHAHVFPRRADEPQRLVTAQPWAFDWQAADKFSPQRHGELVERLRRAFATAA